LYVWARLLSHLIVENERLDVKTYFGFVLTN
jgi:hypothetical protein